MSEHSVTLRIVCDTGDDSAKEQGEYLKKRIYEELGVELDIMAIYIEETI